MYYKKNNKNKMNKKISSIFGISVILIVATSIGVIVLMGDDGSDTLGGPGEMPPQPVGCTSEAKVCPDGSAVGRTGPNCEFESCSSGKDIKKENSIIGEWFPVDTSAGGIGSGFEFFDDGKYTQISGAYLILKYDVEGDTLTTYFPDEPSIEQKMDINGDKMRLIDRDGNIEELSRISGGLENGIVGKWTGDHYTGGKQIIVFTESQNEYFSVPMYSSSGMYEVLGDTIMLYGDEDNSTSKFQWSVSDNKLTITTEDGENLKYMK